MRFVLMPWFLFAFSTSAFADWTKLSFKDFALAPPPADGSREHKREVQQMLDYQNGERGEACALARRQRFASYKVLFGRSEILSDMEVNQAKPLLTKVMKIAERVCRHYKQEFARPRPFAADHRVQPCADKPSGKSSYPSSHAAMATAGACVLAQIFPRKRRAIEGYGEYLGELRTIVGAHYPSDVRAGQELGERICASLLADENFRAELEPRLN